MTRTETYQYMENEATVTGRLQKKSRDQESYIKHKWIVETAMEYQRKLYFCYIDYIDF